MRPELHDVVKSLFLPNDYERFERFARIVEYSNNDKDKHIEIWKYDQSIGGLGGYACPLEPTINPFNKYREYRNVFRSLQYARSDMFFGMRPRHIIEDAGLHLESTAKAVLHEVIPLSGIFSSNPLGKNVERLLKAQVITSSDYNVIKKLIEVYNFAKHDTDEHNPLTFDYLDCVVFYFSCRIVGNLLLEHVGHPTCSVQYEISM